MGGGKEMRLKRAFIMTLSCSILIGFLFILSYGIDGDASKKEFVEISVITREKNSNSFETIKQGIEQAANDMRVEVSYITLSEKNSAAEQIELINREVNNGAKALLLSAANSKALGDVVTQISTQIPVISIESPVEVEKSFPSFTGDNLKMGEALAKRIIYKGVYDKQIVILTSSQNCNNIVQRQEGIVSILNAVGAEIVYYTVPDDGTGVLEAVNEMASKKKADIIVALEPFSLEIAAQAIQNMQNPPLLYGIGVTGKIASYLEKNIIDTVVVQNDFNIGYLGMKAAVNAIEKKFVTSNTNIEYRLINSSNMYTTESQRLLFPFVR